MKKNTKEKLRSKADKLWYQRLLQENCEVCGMEANQVHHFYRKGGYPHLRYDLENGISICQSCHFKLHFTDNPDIVVAIIKNRGEEWYKSLKERSKEKNSSYQGIKYYEDIIKCLEEIQ